MKSSFIRCLWGIYEHEERRLWKRRLKIDTDIELVKKHKYQIPFRTYVWGIDNYNYLKEQGFDVKLADERPIVWDMDTQQYRHKLEGLKSGMEDFDEIVLLDWDCIPINPVPDNFWDILRAKGEPFQAILRSYKRQKALWRQDEPRKVPSASFVYVGDKKVAEDLIKTWEALDCPWSEEVVMAKYTDDLSGGWKNVDYYVNRFEPDFYSLFPEQDFMKDKIAWKKDIFQHFYSRKVKHMLENYK